VKVKKHSKCNDAECLEKISTESLRSAFAASAGKTSWGPAVDGVSLEDEPFNLIRHGKYNDKVPIMIGSNRDEMAFFTEIPPLTRLFPHTMGAIELDVLLDGLVGWENVAAVKALYSPSNYSYPADLGGLSQEFWTAVRVVTDAVPGLGACAARNVSQNFHKYASPAVFTYLFAHPPKKRLCPGALGTVPHASEIAFVFSDPDGIADAEEGDLSSTMSQYWSNFAVTGNPNGGDLPTWPEYGKDQGDTVLRLQTVSDGGIVADTGLRKAQCDFWDAHPGSFGTGHPSAVLEEIARKIRNTAVAV